MDNAIDFSFYQQADEQQQWLQLEQDELGLELGVESGNDSDLLRQFHRIFAPIVEDSLQLYYELNSQFDDDAVQHVRIHRTVAELNELTSSEEETLMTQLQSGPELEPEREPELEQELPSVESSSTISTTSSSCLYAMHTPPPPCLESPQSEMGAEPLTITEQVQLHAPPGDNNNAEQEERELEEQQDSSINNNNTSCSLSSTLTDSKTLDARTPIVV